MPSLGYQHSHESHWELWNLLFLSSASAILGPGMKQKIQRFTVGSVVLSLKYLIILTIANTVSGAHWRYYWPLFWEGRPPRTNQLLLFCSKWKSPLNCFRSSAVEVPSRDPALQGWRREDCVIRPGIWSKVRICGRPVTEHRCYQDASGEQW